MVVGVNFTMDYNVKHSRHIMNPTAWLSGHPIGFDYVVKPEIECLDYLCPH
jgi:hypothetical protein